MGLVLTLFLVRITVLMEDEMRKKAFVYQGKTASENVAEEMKEIRNLYLPGLVAYYQRNEKITRESFRSYSRTLLKKRSLAGMGWAPRVRREERERFENEMRRGEAGRFSIFSRYRRGEGRPSGTSSEFYPLCFVEPYDEIRRAVGF